MDFFEESQKKQFEICKKKNSDYTGDSDDPFANFYKCEILSEMSAAKGVLVRMMDKISRIDSFLDKGILLVADESVEDTCLDLSNYGILLAGILKSEKAKAMLLTEHYDGPLPKPSNILV